MQNYSLMYKYRTKAIISYGNETFCNLLPADAEHLPGAIYSITALVPSTWPVFQ
jgi:hypothetical protein